MKTNAVIAMLGIAAVVTVLAALYTRTRLGSAEPLSAARKQSSNPASSEPAPGHGVPEPLPTATGIPSRPSRTAAVPRPTPESDSRTNKLERLAQVRETFRVLAGGDARVAMRAAKELSDENERETALLTLVTEWTHGELSPARQRAQYIGALGLEVGLGMELIKNPELAVVWASELTEGFGRSALLQRTAATMAATDPAGALALSAEVPESERQKFSEAVYARWAADDTAAALQWAEQLPDPGEREAALQAVRDVAPVGIGTEMRMQDGYPVINRVIPGTPAELSGQLHPGDRIVALAQGDNTFVEARSLSLQQVVQMIRGAPGTILQLQVLPADALPDSMPQTISIIRDQIKFKK